MKHLIVSVIFICACTAVFAQNVNPVQKKISVTGTAEMEIVPDEIYFRIVLKEYLKDKHKVPLEKLEKELTQAVTVAGIAKEDFMVEQVEGYSWSRKRKDDAELYNSKSFIIKVSAPGKIDEVLGKANPESIYSVGIRNYSHSKIEEYKKLLKIQAIKAAKAKADYLLEAIDEKLGSVLEVSEYDNNNLGGFYMEEAQISNNAYMQYNNSVADEYPSVGFQKIKLQFQVSAVFAIQ
jgi:uncharacterized protein